MDSLTPIRKAKNQAYSDYFKKWLSVEKAKNSNRLPTEKELEEVKQAHKAYREILRYYNSKLQEKYNVTGSNFSNG